MWDAKTKVRYLNGELTIKTSNSSIIQYLTLVCQYNCPLVVFLEYGQFTCGASLATCRGCNLVPDAVLYPLGEQCGIKEPVGNLYNLIKKATGD